MLRKVSPPGRAVPVEPQELPIEPATAKVDPAPVVAVQLLPPTAPPKPKAVVRLAHDRAAHGEAAAAGAAEVRTTVGTAHAAPRATARRDTADCCCCTGNPPKGS